MAERDDLDRLLDAALSTYAEVDPNLAPRVLAQVTARAARNRRMRWLWTGGLATAAAAALLLLFAVPWRTPQPQHTQHTEALANPQPKPFPLTEARRPAVVRVRRPGVVHPPAVSRPVPKEPVFPAAHPLSPEERALLRLVNTSSTEQRESLLQQQQQGTVPLRISAISIPPISSPSEGKE